jgi:ParB-like chromosome segregation protein Spo0J
MTQTKKIAELRQKIVYIPIDFLNPATYNPRKHSERQMQALMQSIRSF